MDFDFDLKGTECFSIFVDFWNFTKFTGAQKLNAAYLCLDPIGALDL